MLHQTTDKICHIFWDDIFDQSRNFAKNQGILKQGKVVLKICLGCIYTESMDACLKLQFDISFGVILDSLALSKKVKW